MSKTAKYDFEKFQVISWSFPKILAMPYLNILSMRDMIDQFVDAFGEAIADIRHKLIDEGWFGWRAMPDATHAHSMSETLGWTTHAEREARGWQDPARRHEPERDHGMER